ncbi:hypothetical protein AQUCO_02200228v1 [Aquilegia coerulea]|uniref:F-box domain-containing protein n=1 Tax=Aquilegia coerulea TaxID=218851 RepID=A0A2G5DDP0_AQUCA|nr:hypothetical protein AQUCO_02200228v1 [Aquilegia coerulea]
MSSSSSRPDLITTNKIFPEPEPEPESESEDYDDDDDEIDHFDRIPDSLLLIVFNRIEDVKSLGRCCVVSRRFHSLVPQVDNVVVRVDCVISDDDSSSSSAASTSSLAGAGGTGAAHDDDLGGSAGVTHHSPTQVLKNFNEIRSLRIELPSGELGIGDAVLLKWRADFGSSLDNCFILGASSVVLPPSSGVTKCSSSSENVVSTVVGTTIPDDNGSIPESFYTNGGLKLRVVWTISSLIAASARHYLLQPIIAEHHTLDSLVLTDADGQGMLCMNKEQLEELRVKPLSPSTASKRTLVPALNMRLWYAPHLELPNGVVLKGATLVAIRPSEQASVKKDVSDGSWVSTAFEEPYGTAAKLLVKRRTYCLEMNSF